MEQDIFGDFMNKIDERSPYLSNMLKDDGDMARIVRLVSATFEKDKPGYLGVKKDVVSFTMIVDTPDGECEKNWDNGSKDLLEQLSRFKITYGSSFLITRRGAKGDTRTRYEISDVNNAKTGTPEDVINE